MPPLKGIDRGINGNLLKALEEIGHGDQIVVVDPSYPIPHDAHTLDYQGDSSTRALRGILALVPTEEGGDLTLMKPDTSSDGNPELWTDFAAIAEEFDLGIRSIYKLTDDEEGLGESAVGFLDYANTSVLGNETLYVRTRDERAYACAMFFVGHSQK